MTRPKHQLGGLRKLLIAAGASVHELPTIEIRFSSTVTVAPERNTIYIFTSVNSVAGARLVMQNWPLQKDVEVFSIGPATTRALQNQTVEVRQQAGPAGNSESLLEQLADRDFTNQQIVIVRGDSGRELLRQSLQQRGATVDYLQVYSRVLPQYSAQTIATALDGISVVCISSDLGLRNLLTLVPVANRPSVFDTTLVVNSERCAKLAATLGFTGEILATHRPGDEGQMEALHHWMTTMPGQH